ncbi:hypothetical protein K469DRAFT_754875 [Zopfia rhizophila CBS 207.26]|uniref:Uncharacterized protein n=1 Tax=Zopfia rhizophila CBS 207.26 TaxID=1314779 RepID=A0A6A6DER8_9PEZI|nr:hypothetical protein K469DRAFT_754875 [Zopfia rhizophila CBS 207.26]
MGSGAMPPTSLAAATPSPKRKRDPPPHVPLLNTTLRTASTPPRASPVPSGADSPRNIVADQLRDLKIQAIPMSPLTPTDDVIRKRPKLDTVLQDIGGLGDLKSEAEDKIVVSREVEREREIPETPQLHASPQAGPRISQDLSTIPISLSFTSESSISQLLKQMEKKKHSTKSKQRKKSPSPPPSSLTWQDTEITGHLVDPSTDPDDDGTGLNGIGFKPTPALAYARAQRRRQQVLEWRAREAREARAKRSERRRRGVGGSGIGSREGTAEREGEMKTGETTRRVVRFAA